MFLLGDVNLVTDGVRWMYDTCGSKKKMFLISSILGLFVVDSQWIADCNCGTSAEFFKSNLPRPVDHLCPVRCPVTP